MKIEPRHKQAVHLWPKLEKKINALLVLKLSDEILRQHLERAKNNWPSNLANGNYFYEDVEGIHNVLIDENYYTTYHQNSPKEEITAIREFVSELSIFGQYVANDEGAMNDHDRQGVQDIIDGKKPKERIDTKTHPAKVSPEAMPDVKARMEKDLYSPAKNTKERIPNT